MKNILIVHSKNGVNYSRFIHKEVNLLGVRGVVGRVDEIDPLIEGYGLTPRNSLVHFRTAGPISNAKAKAVENLGFRVINRSEVLERTSDKYKTFEWAKGKGLHLAETQKIDKDIGRDDLDTKWKNKEFVLKPINSMSQGAYCFKTDTGDEKFEIKLQQVPGNEVILQELIRYRRIYRVIVVAGKALERAVFMDEPREGDWKVSVCLNLKLRWVEKPDDELLRYAERVAEVLETEIGFVDVFETDRGYTLSEINTACSLIIHERKSRYNIAGEIAKYLVGQLT